MIRQVRINVFADRRVSPNHVKLANQYEILTNELNFHLNFEKPDDAKVYIILMNGNNLCYLPLFDNKLMIDSSETWIKGGWNAHIMISQAEIVDGKVDKTKALFISNAFGLYLGMNDIDINKLQEQGLPAQLQLVYDELLVLKDELEEKLDSMDQTVPEWALQPEKPSYSASEVGADPDGTAKNIVSEHNNSTESHPDLREAMKNMTATGSWNTLKKKPFGYYESGHVVFEGNVETSSTEGVFNGVNFAFIQCDPAIGGHEYSVEFDGTSYSVTGNGQIGALVDSGYLGNYSLVLDTAEDTGEPFLFYKISETDQNTTILVTTTAGEHNVKVSLASGTYVKIQNCYVPGYEAQLPAITEENEGQFLQVVNGVATWVTLG